LNFGAGGIDTFHHSHTSNGTLKGLVPCWAVPNPFPSTAHFKNRSDLLSQETNGFGRSDRKVTSGLVYRHNKEGTMRSATKVMLALGLAAGVCGLTLSGNETAKAQGVYVDTPGAHVGVGHRHHRAYRRGYQALASANECGPGAWRYRPVAGRGAWHCDPTPSIGICRPGFAVVDGLCRPYRGY
jgi:hypothetical protein